MYGFKIICKAPEYKYEDKEGRWSNHEIDFSKGIIGYAMHSSMTRVTKKQPYLGLTVYRKGEWNIKKHSFDIPNPYLTACSKEVFHFYGDMHQLYYNCDSHIVDDISDLWREQYDMWLIEVDENKPYYTRDDKCVCTKFRFFEKIVISYQDIPNSFGYLDFKDLVQKQVDKFIKGVK